MLTSRMRVLAASFVVAFGLTGAVAASPAFAAGGPDPVPVCTDKTENEPLCLTHGEPHKDGVKARVRVENILCVRADVLSEKEGVEKRSISETVDARVYVPCPPQRIPSFKDCDEANASGVYDILRSDPRYRKHLDSDGDGVACESVTLPSPPLREAPKAQTVEADLPVTG